MMRYGAGDGNCVARDVESKSKLERMWCHQHEKDQEARLKREVTQCCEDETSNIHDKPSCLIIFRQTLRNKGCSFGGPCLGWDNTTKGSRKRSGISSPTTRTRTDHV